MGRSKKRILLSQVSWLRRPPHVLGLICKVMGKKKKNKNKRGRCFAARLGLGRDFDFGQVESMSY